MPRRKKPEASDYVDVQCPNDDALDAWVQCFADIRVPRKAVCPGHSAPFDYLHYAYFEPARDLIVWAPRGGGKTRLAAVATMLDLLHKPDCSVRILGGSLEQSMRMWEHLVPNLVKIAPPLVDRKVRSSARRITMVNGASAAVLTQSERAVRGMRVQKLRCDEVELFDPKIWEAAQLVTRSKTPSPLSKATEKPFELYSGAIEAISTFNRPYGLMSRIIEQAPTTGTKVIRWCLLDVLEKCPAERDCQSCALWDDCKGVAKTRCDGFVRIDDAIAMKHRVGRETWDSEMLCLRPSTSGCVFPTFEQDVHVRETVAMRTETETSLAIDFGFHNPFVCLWVRDDGVNCHVIDEYIQEQRTIDDHIEQIGARRHGEVKRISCDPAGSARNDQTAESNVRFLRRRGFKVHTRKSRIIEGLELIRPALRPAAGEPTLFIHPRCKRLIAAMRQLRYQDGGGELPLKDGTHDHPVDALRYHFVNRGRGVPVAGRVY